MYTENKSIDWLTAITPTIDDLVVTMDQAEVGVAKSSTLLSVYNLFKTTYDTVYAKYLGDADFYKYSIVTSVASGNLTVALKNYEGNDPTPTKPVKIQIGGVIRTITSALSITILWGIVPFFNSGSAELAWKEIDYFTVLIYDSGTSSVRLWITRAILWSIFSDWVAPSVDQINERVLYDSLFNNSGWNISATSQVVNIGRFNATLSAGLAWSIPATSVIINSPKNLTNPLTYLPVLSGWTGAIGAYTFQNWWYQIIEKKVIGQVYIQANKWTFTGGTVKFSLPFSPKEHIEVPFPIIYGGSGTNYSTSLWYWTVKADGNMYWLSGVVSGLSWTSMPTTSVITGTFEYEI